MGMSIPTANFLECCEYYRDRCEIRIRGYNMKCDVNLMLPWLETFYDASDRSYTFDLGAQFMTDVLCSFPIVSIRPDADSLPGFKYYHTLEGTIPRWRKE